MKIVVPMSGVGRRFQEAGYKDPKPLILADGKPIIEHVVGMFPGEEDFLFICNEEHLKTTRLKEVLTRIAPQGRIIAIAPHKLGPVHAVLEAADRISDTEPVVVNYCDFSVEWDWKSLKQEFLSKGYEGAVPAYRGFHPHCLGNTNYAYMREAGGLMLDIQEKQPFTANRMQEFASSGTYLFKDGALMKRAFRALREDAGLALNGEYYVSLAYKFLARWGMKTWIPEIPVMLQWGTPEDLEEYQAWSDYFRQDRGFAPKRAFNGQVLIPAAGAGARFAKEGWLDPKPLIPVSGEPMLVKAAAMLPLMKKRVFACRSEHLESSPLEATLKARFPGAQILPVARLTAGQASTCLLAKGLLEMDAPLMIGACDNGMVWDEAAFAALEADQGVDFAAWTFRGHPGARRKPEAYGWVRADAGGNIQGVSVKKAVSDKPWKDPGIIGAFWYRRAGDFVRAAEKLIAEDRRVNNEFYADSVLNVALELGLKGRIFDVKRYLCWGTPEDLLTWNYWEGHFRRTGAIA